MLLNLMPSQTFFGCTNEEHVLENQDPTTFPHLTLVKNIYLSIKNEDKALQAKVFSATHFSEIHFII